MYRQNGHLALVGRVAGVHGLKGDLVVHPLTDDPERFFDFERVFVATEDPAGAPPQPWDIEEMRVHKGRILLKVKRIDDRDQAERLVGCDVFIPREERRQLEAGQFYIDDLVGLEVFDEGARVGVVSEVQDIPGNPLLEVTLTAGGQVSVPFQKTYVCSVDSERGRVELTPAYKGLMEAEEVR